MVHKVAISFDIGIYSASPDKADKIAHSIQAKIKKLLEAEKAKGKIKEPHVTIEYTIYPDANSPL